MTAQEKLNNRLKENLHICVGLDTDEKKIPEHLNNSINPILEFNKIIIDKTYDAAAAYKINLAFYESMGTKGIDTMLETVEYIPYDTLIIGDAKRGDIGNTSQMYARSIFDEFKFDAVTLHPYMGSDSLSPFFEYKDKINFVLALTSNKGAEDFEKLKLEDGQYLYQKVLSKLKEWNKLNNVGAVFGATNTAELKNNIALLNGLYSLLPGIGAQGGNLSDVVKTFKEAENSKFIINASRAIIYADASENFDNAAAKVLKDYNKTIDRIFNN
ncbi:MAG: orotidine-5'-phosphate decarboxylase [Ignavibacteriae bacterium]|nr:orotidine-5'-phosphate decarboxylase [Ignavibacteriota bacterium]NOG97429.1 orotidine-5'-phosphate decarboxylase [Ignavibacteriota bacterium]